ncbi:MAG: HAMP domain-containing sensor histidine kinase, partial [Elusimicrobiota bacterium]
ILVNPGARRMLGHDGAVPELLDKALDGFECWPPLEALVCSEGRELDFEFRRREPKPLILEGVRTTLESGSADSPSGQLFVFRDVTAKRRDERMARDILSLISHKLRTPLAVMLGYQDVLMEGAEKLDEAQRTALAAIKKQMQKFRYYVDNFLMFMAIRDAKSLKIQREECVPAELIEEAIGELSVPAREHNVRIEYDLKSLGGLKPIKADPRHLSAALRNLIENGIKFNDRPDGDRRLRIEAVELHPDRLKFSVIDNGPGIAPEDRAKVFEGFYQIDDDFTGQIEGLGLGLAYVKLVAEAHGGRSTLESKPGKGSTFTIEIPSGN